MTVLAGTAPLPRAVRAARRVSDPVVRADRALVLLTGLVAAAGGLLFVRAAPETYDSQIMLQVTQGIATGRGLTTTQDIFGFNTPYSSYGIGMSLLMLLPYALARLVGTDPVAAAMDVNALVLGLICACACATALLLGLRRRAAVVVALLIGAGTPLLAYTSSAFSEPGVGLGVAMGLLGLAAMLRERPWGPACAGAGAGVALLMRTDSAVLVVPWLGLATVLLAHRGRRVRELAAAAVPLTAAVGVLAAYNAVRFGSPLRGGYAGQPFDHPVLDGLRGLLVSPARGLLWYCPLAVVLFGALLWARRDERVVAGLAAVLLLVRLVFYARWWAWNGGWCWGPRFLVPAMPGLAVGLIVLARHWPQWGVARRAALGVVAAVSVAVSLVGATVAYEASPLTQQSLSHFDWSGDSVAHQPATQAAVSRAMEEWSLFPVTDEARMLVRGDALAGRAFHARGPGVLREGVLLTLALLGGAALLRLSGARRENSEADRDPASAA